MEDTNFTMMEEIFGEYAVRSGVAPDSMHLVPIHDVKAMSALSRFTNRGGEYSMDEKQISLAPYTYKALDLEKYDRQISFESYILSCYFHEEVHSASFQSMKGLFFKILGDSWDIHVNSQIGYEKNKYGELSSSTTFFKLFNPPIPRGSASGSPLRIV